MDHAIADLRMQGCALAMLSGLRQRYAYFGFEKAGQSFSLTVTSRNFELGHHAAVAAVAAAATLHLALMEPSHLTAVKALHGSQRVCWDRPADSGLMRVMSAWNARPYVALDNNTGEVVGYLVAGPAVGVQGGGRTADPSKLHEVVGRDRIRTLSIIYAWIKSNGVAFSSQDPAATMASFDLPAWLLQDKLGRDLLQIAETTSVTTSSHFLVLDWPAVVDTLLALQARLAQPSLPCGRVVVALDAENKSCIVLEVFCQSMCGSDGRTQITTVGRCTAAREDDQPDVVCSDTLAATRLLLGHTRCAYAMDLSLISAEATRLLDAWCPLPIHWNKQDSV
jgi:hypothetical protein